MSADDSLSLFIMVFPTFLWAVLAMIGPMHLIVKVIVSYGWYDFDKMAVFSEKISIKNNPVYQQGICHPCKTMHHMQVTTGWTPWCFNIQFGSYQLGHHLILLSSLASSVITAHIFTI